MSSLCENIKIPYTEPNIRQTLVKHLSSIIQKVSSARDIVIVCVGTDRSTGDSLGPLVGTALKKSNHKQLILYGTLDEPVHAVNLKDTIDKIQRSYQHPFVIAVDACLGQLASVGSIQIGDGPVKPGAGVNKDLPPIGDIHVTGIVNVGGFMEYFVLQNTRLSLVINMAEIIAESIQNSIVSKFRFQVTSALMLD